MRYILLSFIAFYRFCISPLLPMACRFAPTCSEYARDAVIQYGAFKGSMFAFKRILRCHPYGHSGFDPIPCPKEHVHEK